MLRSSPESNNLLIHINNSPEAAAPHSHSILSTHRNALIYQRKFFLLTVQTRPSSRQNFPLLISKENSRDSDFARLRQPSPTIGQFFALSIAERILRPGSKKTVST
jgi:hypothetical protein